MRSPPRIVCIFIGLVSSLSALSAQQAPAFSSRGELVRLDVLVADGGRPVVGLKPSDFTVLDNGVLQTIEFMSADSVPLNVVLNFDVSGSVAGQKLQDLRTAGTAVLDALRAGDRAALLSFTQAVSIRSALSADLAPVRRALDTSQPAGQTALVDSSLAGVAVAASSSGRSLLLTFSDGADTASVLPPASVVDAARRTEVAVFGISTGRLSTTFLRDLADATGGEAVEIRSTAELRNALLKILSEYRQRYLLAYSPSGVASPGWHSIKVAVSKKGATVKARQGYER